MNDNLDLIVVFLLQEFAYLIVFSYRSIHSYFFQLFGTIENTKWNFSYFIPLDF